jgi:hypothetical protein
MMMEDSKFGVVNTSGSIEPGWKPMGQIGNTRKESSRNECCREKKIASFEMESGISLEQTGYWGIMRRIIRYVWKIRD